jgi:GNAT superfamily N-acetyltransferase
MPETTTRPATTAAWPAHLRPGALRWARSSGRYEETVRFYRDLVGLPVVGSFTASFGADGIIFGLPGDQVQLEIVRAEEPPGRPDPHDHVVLYLPGAEALDTATRRLRDAGLRPDPSVHPYWAANGAVRYLDPDGRGVVYAPWVYGREPDPTSTRIEVFTGNRSSLRPLFELAEDSATELDSYLASGRILVALEDDQVIGHLQLVDTDRPGVVELKNMAVREDLQGRGTGRRLVRAAIDLVASERAATVLVATAGADIGNLRFYQRQGFRLHAIERDAFTAHNGYRDVVIDGIQLRDRVWLEYHLPR